MGLCYGTSKWSDMLWSDHVKKSYSAQRTITQGTEKQKEFAAFAEDLHYKLYIPGEHEADEKSPDWAKKLLQEAEQVAEWQRLRAVCAKNGFAAGIAAESVLTSLLEQVPKAAEQPPVGDSAGGGAKLRAALRAASRAAGQAVAEAEATVGGVSRLFGLSAGSQFVNPSFDSISKAKEIYQKVGRNDRIRNIIKMVGRFERAAASKVKAKVRPAVGQYYGVECGGDLSRLLPSELVSLTSAKSKLRLLGLSKLVERRSLQYALEGTEPKSKGPVLVLIDQSGSMRGDKDDWAKAVALAIMSIALKEKRSCRVLGFHHGITFDVGFDQGATVDSLLETISSACAGGTSFTHPVERAVHHISNTKEMHDADVVIITDGEADLDVSIQSQAQALTKKEGVSWYVVGIGSINMSALSQIATSTVLVNNLDNTQVAASIVALD